MCFLMELNGRDFATRALREEMLPGILVCVAFVRGYGGCSSVSSRIE